MIAFLIRHAETASQGILGQRAEASLNAAGEKQSASLSAHFRNVSLAAVLSSPLRRAMQTAQRIAAINVPLIPEDALREVNFGDWDNRTFADLEESEHWRTFHRFRSGSRYPGGEMMIEVQARLVALLERSSRHYGDASVAFVSHADVIRCAVCHYLGTPLDLALRIRIDTASSTTLRLDEHGVEVIGVNEKA